MDRLIVAEMSSNHNGDIELLKRMIQEAKNAGANIAKFQLYDTDKLVREPEYLSTLRRGQLSYPDWLSVVAECRSAGIGFLASVFDTKRVKWCQEVNMTRYKISSFDIYNEPLIEAVLKTGMDIIMSLGMADKRGIPKIEGTHIDYLYCVSKYPAELKDIKFPDFRIYSGFSDHTTGIEASVMAMAKGARIIEKHFTLNKNMDGWDHHLSMDVDDLREIVRYARAFEKVNG